MNGTAPSPPTASQIDALINVGLVIEYFLPAPYQALPMNEVIPAIVSPNSTAYPGLPPVNVTVLMEPIFGSTLNVSETLAALDGFLTVLADNKTTQAKLSVSTWILTLAALAAMGVRLYARAGITREIKLYDWVAALAMLLSIGLAFTTIYSVHMYDEGKHIYNISYNNVKNCSLFIVIGGYLYHFAVNTVKVSLLLFYLCLSPHGKFRRACFATLAIVTVGIILGIFFITFGCTPFDFWNHPLTAKCLPRVVVYDLSGILQIITDVIIWTLPIPIVWQLPLRIREKSIVIGTFAIGSLVCVASFLRLFKISEFVSAADHTYDTTDAIIWSVAEVNLAIIVSCVPAIKSFVVRYAPSILGKSTPDDNTIAKANDIQLKPKPSAWKKMSDSLLFGSKDEDDLKSKNTATTVSSDRRSRDEEMGFGPREGGGGGRIMVEKERDIFVEEERAGGLATVQASDVSLNYKSTDESSKESSRSESSARVP